MQRAHAAILFIQSFLFIALLGSCTGPQPRTGPVPEKQGRPRLSVSGLERQIHLLINKERQKHSLPLLEWSDTLATIARKHSKDMSGRNYFAHNSPEGRDFSFRYQQEGYTCEVRVGRTIYQGAENLAQNNLYDSITTVNGKPTHIDWNSQEKLAETTVQGWMKSPGHRKNILTPHFQNEGIGVVIAPDDKVYVTQNFC
jgi:uncharacterized protein YkwD